MRVIKNKQKKSMLIIGLGRFGKHLAINLQKLGNDVMAVDKEERIVQNIAHIIDDVICGDCTDENVLAALGIGNFDMCFVTIGKNFESSLIITSRLRKMGAKYIVTKAGRDIQTDILKKIGADEVIYPERELAEKLAFKYSSSRIFDYIDLTDDYQLYEIAIPDSWVGKNIGTVHVRRKYKMNIIAIKSGENLIPTPGADYTFSKGDVIVSIGKQQDVIQLN